jgi:hypothetical protein
MTFHMRIPPRFGSEQMSENAGVCGAVSRSGGFRW